MLIMTIRQTEWAREKRATDPEFRKRLSANSMHYFRTEKGKEAKRRAGKKYRETHKEAINADKRRRFHSKSPEEKLARGTRIRYGIDFNLFEKKCGICSRTCDLTLDHKHPVSKGGRSTVENMWVLCKSCNCFKSDRLMTSGLALLVGEAY